MITYVEGPLLGVARGSAHAICACVGREPCGVLIPFTDSEEAYRSQFIYDVYNVLYVLYTQFCEFYCLFWKKSVYESIAASHEISWWL